MDFGNVEDIIKNSNKILIISHINPDGDALGATFALYSAIYDRYKKKCDVCTLTYTPPLYKFLPYFDVGKHNFDTSLVYDLVITADVAAIDRIGDMKPIFDRACKTINIDHHKTNNNFGDYNFVDGESSSTGEVLFELFINSGWNISLNTAKCLYTAILTDTGGFRFDNTSSKTFVVASELVKIGVNPNEIYSNCYESKSKEYVMFQNYCIGKTQFVDNDTIAYTAVYRKDFEKFNAKNDYTEGIAEDIRAINTVDIAFVVKEIDYKICKISIRSKKYDVAEICSVFGGGGHARAAGCTIKFDVETAVEKLLAEIRKHINGQKSI